MYLFKRMLAKGHWSSQQNENMKMALAEGKVMTVNSHETADFATAWNPLSKLVKHI